MKDKDLNQISKLFFESFAQIWEHNLEPVLNDIKSQITNQQIQINNLPNKEYIDDKIGELRGEFNLKFKK